MYASPPIISAIFFVTHFQVMRVTPSESWWKVQSNPPPLRGLTVAELPPRGGWVQLVPLASTSKEELEALEDVQDPAWGRNFQACEPTSFPVLAVHVHDTHLVFTTKLPNLLKGIISSWVGKFSNLSNRLRILIQNRNMLYYWSMI
jgi:hypothetical protein